MTARTWAGVLVALVSAGLYGLIPPLARLGFEHGVPPHDAVAIRTVGLLAVSGLLVALFGSAPSVPRRGWPWLAALSLSSASVSICYLSAVSFISVGLAVIVFYTFPIVVLLLSPLLEGRPIGWTRLGLALMAFAGLTVAIGPSLAALDWRGLALAGVASLSATAQFFSARGISRCVASDEVHVFWTHLVMTPVLVATAFVLNGAPALAAFAPGHATAIGIVALAGLCLSYVGGYLTQMRALRQAPPSAVAPIFNIEPVVSLAVAGTFLGETLTANQYAGGALVVLALLLSGLIRRRHPLAAGPAAVQAGGEDTPEESCTATPHENRPRRSR